MLDIKKKELKHLNQTEIVCNFNSMDKPSLNNLYAGLIIYRIQRKNNIEYLLLNDTFTNKKHWFCPKGQVIGNEDSIK